MCHISGNVTININVLGNGHLKKICKFVMLDMIWIDVPHPSWPRHIISKLLHR